MKYRTLTASLKKTLKTFPVIVVTGPRQSGKTTLLKTLLSETHRYINLEDPKTRLRAKEDPELFLDQYMKQPVILDEIQYVPELLPYIKIANDQNRRPGKWILTGSQNFTLMRGVSESLAGQAAILSLLPFSFAEYLNKGKTTSVHGLLSTLSDKPTSIPLASTLRTVINRGFYPEIASKRGVDRDFWCGSYIATYLERDIRNLSQVDKLNQFERFVKLCATRTGQILNITDLARDTGIAVSTAQSWLSLLQTGYQIFLLYPYYKNIGKRLIKSPKLYFNDTALAAYLLGIREDDPLEESPYFPALFETMIIVDFWKRFLHTGQLPALYYLRTRDGLEVDLVLESRSKLYFFEIKSGRMITSNHALALKRIKKEFGKKVQTTALITQSSENFFLTKDIMVYNWKTILTS